MLALLALAFSPTVPPAPPELAPFTVAQEIAPCATRVVERHDGRPDDRPVEPVAFAPPPIPDPCQSADFSGLTPSELVEAVSQSSRDCVGVLRFFDSHVLSVLTEAHVQAVAEAIMDDVDALQTYSARIRQLAYFIQIAYYHEYYEAAVDYGSTTHAATQGAMVAMAESAEFFDESTAMGVLREQWSATTDSVGASHQVIDTLEAMLGRYLDTPVLAALPVERNTVYNVLFTLARQIDRYQSQGASSPWYGAIPEGLIDHVQTLAVDTDYTSQTEYLVQNASWVLGHFSYLDAATVDAGHEGLSAAYAVQTDYSPVWLRNVLDLERFYDATLFNGTPLDMVAIRAAVRAIALPTVVEIDQGEMRFEANVDDDTLALLYDAMQEVESQFFRLTGALQPAPGEEHEALTLVVYGSWEDYRVYQPFLHGLSTNNGGLFVEAETTLYTYERTPEESIYTLEELLRLEVVHHLDARYLVQGTIGDPDTLHEDGRLTWYTEGLAELLVGSTRRHGLLSRRTLFDQIDEDAEWMTVAEVLAATYDSGFDFYRYSAALFGYLATQEPERLAQLFAAVRRNDASAFDTLVDALGADTQAQSGYEAFVAARIAASFAGDEFFAEDIATARTPSTLPVGNRAQVLSILTNTAPESTGTLTLWQDRYRWTDHLLFSTEGLDAAGIRALLNATMDDALVALQGQGSNFTSAVAWFGDLETFDDLALATYVIEGPYSPSAATGPAPGAPTGLTGTFGRGGLVLRWQAQATENGSGFYVYSRANSEGSVTRLTDGPVRERTLTVTPEAPIYVVTAIDAWERESPFSTELFVDWDLALACQGQDSDGDGRGDPCEVCPGYSDWADLDGDGLANGCDACLLGPNGVDQDDDGVADACDLCPEGDDAVDSDNDDTPDACDPCPEDQSCTGAGGAGGSGGEDGGSGGSGGGPKLDDPRTTTGRRRIGCTGVAGPWGWALALGVAFSLRHRHRRRAVS